MRLSFHERRLRYFNEIKYPLWLLWTPAQRKRASMLYVLRMLFFYFFYGRLMLRPRLTEVRETFTHGGV